ncbi:MAG: hydrogenase maturation protease [Leptolyngbyaceae cyanobacterium]
MMPLTQTSPKVGNQTSPALDYDFLIIGYGDKRCGDSAVGPWVATTVADWKLPTVKSFAVEQLTPGLTDELVKTNYVMFVDACGHDSIRTVQIDPIVTSNQQLSSMAFAAHSYSPLALLNLTQRLYQRHPQAWLVQIPIESCNVQTDLSAKARHGCDRALRLIEQFLMTYRQPYLCMKSV